MATEFTEVQVLVRKLEVARGYDGWFGGVPEPVVVTALYAAVPGELNLLGRCVTRFAAPKPFPKAVFPSEPFAIRAKVGTVSKLRFLMVAVGLEEDNATDVQRVYGMMERAKELSFWTYNNPDPTPIPLHRLIETSQKGRWHYPTRTHLCLDGRDVETTCDDDKWVGCCTWVASPRSGHESLQYRAHMLASDEKNDWTAIIEVTL